MNIGDIYKTKNEGRQSNCIYIKIIGIFKPGTYQYKYEKDKLGSEGKGIKGIFIKYERSDSLKFDYVYTNYMKRTDFLFNFKRYLTK